MFIALSFICKNGYAVADCASKVGAVPEKGVLSQMNDVPDGRKSGIPLRLRFFSLEISVFWDLAFGVAGPIDRNFS